MLADSFFVGSFFIDSVFPDIRAASRPAVLPAEVAPLPPDRADNAHGRSSGRLASRCAWLAPWGSAIQSSRVSQSSAALAKVKVIDPSGLYGGALLLAWLLLAGPVLPGLATALLEAEARPQLLLAATLLTLAGLARLRQARRAEGSPRLGESLWAGPALSLGPLLLLVLSALALSLGRFLLWPAALLGLPLCSGSYALLGLYRPPSVFRRGLPLLLFVLLLVPFQFHLDAMLGFHARRLVAWLVQLQLGWLSIPATAVQSVLLLEGGAAHVDLPCSGLRSLWTGALFYVGLSGFRRTRLNLRWLCGLGLLLFTIVYLNQARVLILVLLANVWHRSDLAELVHVPLGLLFFLLACALASLLLPPRLTGAGGGDAADPVPPRLSRWGLLGLCALLLGLSRFAASSPPPQPLQVPAVQLPPDWRLQPLVPQSAEVDLLARHGGVLHKWRFVAAATGGRPALSGTLLLSISRSFQAQHSPHACLATAGLQVTEARRVWLRPDLPLAQLSLARFAGSAVYWFQSATETTDNVLRRSLPRWPGRDGAANSGPPPPWALVSILFDGPVELEDPRVREPLLLLHSAVAATLRGTL